MKKVISYSKESALCNLINELNFQYEIGISKYTEESLKQI